MDELRNILENCGALHRGHFIGTSGRHLATYLAKDAIMPHTAVVSKVCDAFSSIAERYTPDAVVGPTTCGIILSQWTAHHLSEKMGHEVLSLFTDEEHDQQFLKRRYDALVNGKRVVVVEDVVNTGKSIKEVIDEVERFGGRVVLALSMFNRNESDEKVSEILGVPYQSLLHIPLESWAEGEVPEWLSAIPVSTTYGHGSQYLDGRKDN